ncbi:uncharacterized protein L969DRAFT_334160 [Mixia osmundae IAM 14324]|uniref:Peptidase A1 domain-containing protein n=1 Tax=Mixia osmundae (strain CBS 9802 / IAM 14324 / JCM 22182 / KY 12970) TaxID=764103 RepID=G7E6A5_MIXOS|nr:uncharacterized protein L969DRAFT_334160 [Mixia osmundae IAM 14324]KEI40478.1 hypothetical protein L969DRAFT_334160 [Mixia osmundae IAM 14324]GAA98365.1 hypothetical protein E5Q_05051 [Mixia osmundae IAM 14324]
MYAAGLVALVFAGQTLSEPIKLAVHHHYVPAHRAPVRRGDFAMISTAAQSFFALNVTVGTERGAPSFYNLLIDTGSAVTYLSPYQPGPHVRYSGFNSSTVYADGSEADGVGYIDVIRLDGSRFAVNATFAGTPGTSKTDKADPEEINGLVALGPQKLSEDDWKPTSRHPGERPLSLIPQMVHDKIIDEYILGLGFRPLDLVGGTALDVGSLMLGGCDASVMTGPLTWTRRTGVHLNKAGKERQYYSVYLEIPSLGVHKTDKVASLFAIDTGSTQTYLPEAAYRLWLRKSPVIVFDDALGVHKVPKASVSKIHPIDYTIEGKTYTLKPEYLVYPDYYAESQTWPTDHAYIMVGIIPDELNIGGIIGAYHLIHLYVCIDEHNNPPRIGFATTKYS